MNRFTQEPSPSRRDRGSAAETSHKSGRESGFNQNSGTGSTITSEVQGALDQQVIRAARMVSNVARSTRRTAEELKQDELDHFDEDYSMLITIRAQKLD